MGAQNSGCRKFWLPASPECTFTATLPASSTPSFPYSSTTFSGEMVREKKTFGFMSAPSSMGSHASAQGLYDLEQLQVQAPARG